MVGFFGGRGSAVSGLRSLSRLWEGGSAFALCARGEGVRLQGSLRPDTAPLRFFGGRGSAVSGLRSLSRLWEGGSAFALCARGLVFASKARSGPTPLRYIVRGIGPPLAE